jgi:hypothetical protein
MASNIARMDERRVAAPLTPAAEQVLRSIAYSARAGEDDESIRRRITPAIAAAITTQVEEAQSRLTPATRRDAKQHLGPTLTLVAPAGMSEDDQTIWLASAMETLSGIPADLLATGCMEARRKVDHPAKIVPAIFKAIGQAWDVRKADLRDALKVERIAQLPAPSEPDVATPEQAAEALGEFSAAFAAKAKRSSKPLPTVQAYIDLGLSEAEAKHAVAEQQKARAA